MLRSELYADPKNIFVHDAILASCQKRGQKIALVDVSCGRRLNYAEYGEMVETLARGLVSAGVRPGEVIAIFLPNSWEFCVAYHAATLAGAIPTLLNPTYREREVRYQLENSGAVLLITDAPNIAGVNLANLPELRRVFYPGAGTRKSAIFQPAEAGDRHAATARSRIAGNFGGVAIFQRHDRPTEGSDALAFQPDCQRLSVAGSGCGPAEARR